MKKLLVLLTLLGTLAVVLAALKNDGVKETATNAAKSAKDKVRPAADRAGDTLDDFSRDLADATS